MGINFFTIEQRKTRLEELKQKMDNERNSEQWAAYLERFEHHWNKILDEMEGNAA